MTITPVRRSVLVVLVAALAAAGCAADESTATRDPSAPSAESADAAVFDDTVVHDLSVSYVQADYDGLIEAYQSTGDKEWIAATVTIDGSSYENVGLRLKGNSSLMGLRTDGGTGRAGGGPGGEVSADEPQSLPWLVRFDKYVEDQAHEGVKELVIRSNSSETSLNEAVALELLEQAGLASQDAAASRVSMNGSDPELRLIIEHPDEAWVASRFGTEGSLYKAESTGDYSYRGDDPADYAEVFDLEAGDDEDLVHLTEFLEFINEADDETFSAELADHLDVDAFASYLAMQELLGNFDDIDGPGNNSYLYFDPDSGRMTVVPWDMNLAFGAMGGGGPGAGGMELPEGGELPEGFEPPAGMELPDGAGARPAGPGGAGGMRGGTNVLVQRFLADEAFAQQYDDALERLRSELFESGEAAAVLERWVAVLEAQATDVVDEATIASEQERIAASL